MIERFPMRHSAVVWLLREASGAWLVLARDAGWIHGDYRSALADAEWMA
jgi:hypothetical protein